MPEHISGAVDARPFAVPKAEHAVVTALAAHLSLLRSPDGGGGKVLVQARPEHDIARLKLLLRAPELLVEPAERRTAVAADETCRIEAGAAIALLLHQKQPYDRLRPGDDHLIRRQIIFIVETYPVAGHPILAGL